MSNIWLESHAVEESVYTIEDQSNPDSVFFFLFVSTFTLSSYRKVHWITKNILTNNEFKNDGPNLAWVFQNHELKELQYCKVREVVLGIENGPEIL